MAIRNAGLGGTDYQDTGSTTLDGAINDTDTTITVVDTSTFKSAGTIRIDSELIDYTGTTATTFTGCTRGQYGTTAASHTDTTAVAEKEVVKATDLNDTFDAAFDKIKTLSAFWLNTELYDVYDDFDSYGAGAFTTNTNWTISTVNSASATIVVSTQAGGSTNELRLSASGNSGGDTGEIVASTKLLAQNKHKHLRARVIWSTNGAGTQATTGSVELKIGGQSYTTIATVSGADNTSGNCYFDITVVAQGSNVYDLYVGGKKLFSSITESDPQIYFKVQGTGFTADDYIIPNVYIDDVVESAFTIS